MNGPLIVFKFVMPPEPRFLSRDTMPNKSGSRKLMKLLVTLVINSIGKPALLRALNYGLVNLFNNFLGKKSYCPSVCAIEGKNY